MRRLLCGLALGSLLLAGCASTQKPLQSGTYFAPAQAYTLELGLPVFRGGVTLSEQCNAEGGTLNIWDNNKRFFRIDYLKVNSNPLAMVPAFANERTISDIVLAGYLRDVLPKAKGIKRSEVMFKDFVNTKRGEALMAVIGLEMDQASLPSGVSSTEYYYGFLIFQQGDFAYVVQHRADAYQPDRIKNMVEGLAGAMAIPGKPRGDLLDTTGESSGYFGNLFGGSQDSKNCK